MKRLVLGLMLLAQPALAETVTLGCLFDQKCQANGTCAPDEMRLRIVYQTRGGDATVTGVIGSHKAEIHPGPDVISFIETRPDGLVLVTSVQAGDGGAIQSVHRAIRGVIYPTQYLGRCVPIQ